MTEVAVRKFWDDKWPRLVVAGEPIHPRQAECILVRTMLPHLHCNDRAWESAAARIMGLFDPYDHIEDSRRGEKGYLTSLFDREDASHRALGILPLHYLHTSRICSSWIGGVHGWCDWGGRIGCANYNIGKWPSQDEVTQDWALIAAAFPFLDLRSQLVSLGYDEKYENETPLPEGRVWGTWTVKAGKVTFDEGETTLLELPERERIEGPDAFDLGYVILTGGQKLTLEALEAIVKRVKNTLPDGERMAIDG